ncbi:MAG: LysR substrate-binding domain-containing protein [Marinobacterium sp.]|nr:LysR substrate-binding domain-containing protein [Marinobacterium sp.]
MLLSRVSLNALRTFAEVARYQSLSKAAARLCISPSAVSHQMKLLEQQLETKLLIRRSQGVELTDSGQQLACYAITAMQQLEQGLQSTLHPHSEQLKVAIIPALLQRWLVPRLAHFYHSCPRAQLTLIEQDSLADFQQQDIDLHLHFGSGEFTGLRSERLMPEQAVPVCSPSLLASRPNKAQLTKNRLLTKIRLLQDDCTRRLYYTGFEEDKPGGLSWQGWYNQTDMTLNQQQPVTGFSHMGSMLSAAQQGVGVALGWQQLIQPSLENGSLVCLSEIRVPLKYSYYAVAPTEHFERPAVQQFLHWLRSSISCS